MAIATAPPIEAVTPAGPSGLWGQAARRLKRNRLAVGGLGIIAAFAVIGLLAPVVATHDPSAQDLGATFAEPGSAHLMGTDVLGRDWFSRLIYGTRLALTV